MRLLRWFSLLPLLLTFLAGSGCDRNQAPAATNQTPTVEVSEPVRDTIVDHEVFTGRTQAMNRVDLRARVTGFLDVVYVGDDANVPAAERIKEGTDVKKGQVLFVLKQEPFQAALQQARATREQAHKTIAQQEATRVSQMEQARYNKDSYDRYRKAGNAAYSPDDIEKAYSGWKTAEAAAKAAEAAKEAAEAAERANEAAEVLAKQNLDWATVHAPFDGRIGKRSVDQGNVVKADDTILASIEQLNPLYGYFDVDERTLLKIGAQLPAGQVPSRSTGSVSLKLGLANEKPEDFRHDGTLQFADNRVDPNTGTLRMWGTFDNSDLTLKSGMFVRVRMGIGAPRPSLFVTESALGSDQGRKFLYVVDSENKVTRVPVEVGQRKNGLIAVEAGLHGSEKVVVTGTQTIRQKMEVVTKLVDMPRVKVPSTTLPVVTSRRAP